MQHSTVEPDFISMDNLDFTLTSNAIQPSSPSEEISARVRYDYNTSESFYEIDVAELNMTMCSEQLIADLFFDDYQINEQLPGSIVGKINEFLMEGTEAFHPSESNDMADRIQSTDEQLAMIKRDDRSLPVSRPHTEKLSTKVIPDQSILLSQSVAVTVPTPNQLQLVYPLEETYRPRYKSDYFPQSGAVRRPRYVADSAGNHFITIQMPSGYSRDFTNKHIRVAFITTSINGRGHFYSPYKFQTDHNDVKVLDQNPIYVPVQTNEANNFTMKLHLVLIKSKLDQLNHAQPLKPFPDTIGSIQNIINDEKLTPKDLISKYQLDKSHIAFTLCTKLSNGSYEFHPETTIISTVITEAPPKPATPSNSKSESAAAVTNSDLNKKIRCPHCANCFDLSNVNIQQGVGVKRKLTKSTPRAASKSTNNNRVNKKKKNA